MQHVSLLFSFNKCPADEDIINIMHRFRPKFLAKSGVHGCFEPYAFKHTCLLQSESARDTDALELGYENPDATTGTTCIAVPYVSRDDFRATSVSEKLMNLIKEV